MKWLFLQILLNICTTSTLFYTSVNRFESWNKSRHIRHKQQNDIIKVLILSLISIVYFWSFDLLISVLRSLPRRIGICFELTELSFLSVLVSFRRCFTNLSGTQEVEVQSWSSRCALLCMHIFYCFMFLSWRVFVFHVRYSLHIRRSMNLAPVFHMHMCISYSVSSVCALHRVLSATTVSSSTVVVSYRSECHH